MDSIILHSTPIQDLKLMIGEVVREQLENIIPKQEKPTTYITRKEAAAKLRIGLSALDTYTKEGILQSYKIRGKVLYKSHELDKAYEAVKNRKYKRG